MKNMECCKITEDDIEKILKKQKITQDQIFLMNIDKNKNFEIIMKE